MSAHPSPVQSAVIASRRPELRLDRCAHEAAKFACERWHYARRVPVFKTVRVGVWENGQFIGVVMFGQGATPELCKPYGLTGIEVCELTRIALRPHHSQVSRIITIAVRMLRRRCPGLRLIVSFADMAQGHHGGVYQAAGWFYSGGTETHAYRVKGVIEHPKTLHSRYGVGGQSIPWLTAHVDRRAQRIVAGFKHRYLLPLDAEMRERITPLSRPYPKRVKQATTGHHPASDGAAPIHTLQTEAA